MSTLRSPIRTLRHIPLKPFVYGVAILLVPLLVGTFNLGVKVNSLVPPGEPPALTQPVPAPPAYDSSRLTAVVLSSSRGAEVTDFLPTYEILARSGRFNVYVVAPQRRILPLVNSNLRSTGLDFMPHFSFAEYDAVIGRAPDVIAVPYFPDYSASRDVGVLDWLRTHIGSQTTVLGICAGTEEVADSGLLEGHLATTNTNWFGRLAKTHPAVRWIHDVRYVDDGPVITSANLAAGMDATLHTVDRFAGRQVADDVASQIGYPGTRYLDDSRWQPSGDALATFAPIAANAAFRWGMQDLGLVLQDGVSELSLASVVDPQTLSLAARIHTLSAQRIPVTSQHGLVLIPRYAFEAAPRLDRILAPGAGGWPYRESMADLARTQGDHVARATGRSLFLATAASDSADAGFAIAPLLGALLLALVGAGLVYGLDTLHAHWGAVRSVQYRNMARFGLHLVEMAVAMELGMVAFGAANGLLLEPSGHLWLTGRHPEAQLLAMAFFMAVPMVVWMLLRGHGRQQAAEMAGAMIVPSACAIVVCSAGLLPRTDLMALGHGLMWIAMLGVMFFRWRHYSGAGHAARAAVTPRATLAAPSPSV